MNKTKTIVGTFLCLITFAVYLLAQSSGGHRSSGGGGVWGSITGTLSDQTDLQSALNVLAPLISPSFTTPALGVATATSINKMAVTAPATSSTLAVADGKTATINNSLTLAGTDSTTQTFAGISGHPWSVISAQLGNTDTVACPNNTTANFATTYTISANYLTTNKLLKITLGFAETSSASPPSSSFRLTIGGTSVFGYL